MEKHSVKNNSPSKSFVSGVLAGHDNRVSCLGVTEVNVFVYIRGHPRKRILHRSHLHPNRMEEQLQLELGTGFFKPGPLILILTGEANAKESVHGTSKELFVESKHEVPPCLTTHKLTSFAHPQVSLFT